MKKAYLTDKSFLKRLFESPVQQKYAQIDVLDWSERVIETIKGRVTEGSINVDGNSAVRRTSNITVLLDDDEIEITNATSLFSINKKIKLSIGIKNTQKDYDDDIIWFPQGVFIIINPSLSHSVSGINLSLQLKDKMALLNGDVGGILPAAVNFAEIEYIDSAGNVVVDHPIIYQIIQELVHHWGGEQLGKIIISDIDNQIKRVMKWVGRSPVYLYDNNKNISNAEKNYILTVKPPLTLEESEKYSNGRDVGFIYSDFIFPGELMGEAGSTITQILDKIKNTLGNYEYFYDVDGNFVFREIKNYLNTTKAKIALDKLNNNSYLTDLTNGKSEYVFNDNKTFISLSNSPQFSMVKNDFLVWGIRNSATGAKTPIRYHLAIDKKPILSDSYFEVVRWADPNDGGIDRAYPLDRSVNNLSRPLRYGIFYLSENKLYLKDSEGYKEVAEAEITQVKSTDWRSEIYLQGLRSELQNTEKSFYYEELKAEWPKIYNLWATKKVDTNGIEYYEGNFFQSFIDTPSNADYYLDFIDTNGKLSAFNIDVIGRRTKVVNDSKVNCVFAPDIPNWIIIPNNLPQEEIEDMKNFARLNGYNWSQVSQATYEQLATGGSSNSAFDYIKDLLYQHTGYNEAITIQTIPLYYLEPNTRITVEDVSAGIYGDYIISTISIPLKADGIMSISCKRILDKI